MPGHVPCDTYLSITTAVGNGSNMTITLLIVISGLPFHAPQGGFRFTTVAGLSTAEPDEAWRQMRAVLLQDGSGMWRQWPKTRVSGTFAFGEMYFSYMFPVPQKVTSQTPRASRCSQEAFAPPAVARARPAIRREAQRCTSVPTAIMVATARINNKSICTSLMRHNHCSSVKT